VHSPRFKERIMVADARTIVRGWRAAEERTGLSRVQLWRLVRAGRFPSPVELGPNSIGFYVDEIARWLESRPRRLYGGAPEIVPQVHVV
jgi:prophage regulatory protein